MTENVKIAIIVTAGGVLCFLLIMVSLLYDEHLKYQAFDKCLHTPNVTECKVPQ